MNLAGPQRIVALLLCVVASAHGQILYNHGGINLIDPDGNNQVKLADGSGARWSPDGKLILFWEGSRPGSISVMASYGTQQRKLALGRNPFWSPDAQRVAYERRDSIFTVELDSKEEQFLGPGRTPVWTPDGTKIFITEPIPPDSNKLLVVNSDGSGRKELEFRVYPLRNSERVFSPNGEQVLVLSGADGDFCVHTMNIDGTNLQTVGEGGRDAAWSPDGSRIAYTHIGGRILGDAHMGVYVVNADGSEPSRLVAGAYTWVPGYPSWSPDGQEIFFHVSEYDGEREQWIYIINVDGTNLRRFVRGRTPYWSPAASDVSAPTTVKNLTWAEVKMLQMGH